MSDQYLAYIRIRNIETREIVHSIGVTNTSEHYVEKVVSGLLMRIDTDKYYIDDSEIPSGN